MSLTGSLIGVKIFPPVVVKTGDVSGKLESTGTIVMDGEGTSDSCTEVGNSENEGEGCIKMSVVGSMISVISVVGSTMSVTSVVGSTMSVTSVVGSTMSVISVVGSTMSVISVVGSTMSVISVVGSTMSVISVVGSTISVVNSMISVESTTEVSVGKDKVVSGKRMSSVVGNTTDSDIDVSIGSVV